MCTPEPEVKEKDREGRTRRTLLCVMQQGVKFTEV